jgi:hypothetical protein
MALGKLSLRRRDAHSGAGLTYKDCCPASAGGKESLGTKPPSWKPANELLADSPGLGKAFSTLGSPIPTIHTHTHTLLSTAPILHQRDCEFSRQSRSHGIRSPLLNPSPMPRGARSAYRQCDASRLQVAAMGSAARCLPNLRSHGHSPTASSSHPRNSQ